MRGVASKCVPIGVILFETWQSVPYTFCKNPRNIDRDLVMGLAHLQVPMFPYESSRVSPTASSSVSGALEVVRIGIELFLVTFLRVRIRCDLVVFRSCASGSPDPPPPRAPWLEAVRITFPGEFFPHDVLRFNLASCSHFP